MLGQVAHVAPALAIVALTCVAVNAMAQVDATQLLQLGADRVKSNAAALRRLTCEEQTSRELYLPPKDVGSAGGSKGVTNSSTVLPLPALMSASLQERKLLWTDRLRVELSLFEGKDMFSWPDGGTFNSGSLDSLVRFGATLSGVLGAFDLSVLMDDVNPNVFRYKQTFQSRGATVAEYTYSVSPEKSHLMIPGATGQITSIPYDGFFLLDASSGDLRRLAIELRDFPAGADLAQGAISTDYAQRLINDTPSFVPVSSTMRLLFRNGELAANSMQYSNCHEFRAESTLRFNSVPESSGAEKAQAILQSLPPGVGKDRLVKLALNAPIDSDTAMTGDPIQAHVTKAVKGKSGRVVIPVGTIAQGRILRLVKYSYPFDVVELIVSFDALKIGGDTVTVHLSPPENHESESGTPQSPQMIQNSRVPFGRQTASPAFTVR